MAAKLQLEAGRQAQVMEVANAVRINAAMLRLPVTPRRGHVTGSADLVSRL